MKPSVSACLIVRNEQAWLPACLESLQGAVDEVVLLDTGSTDETVRIARDAGARVFEAKWGGDFAAARNAVLEQARSDWCLVIDADERLAPETREGLASELGRATEAGLSGISVIMRHFNPPGEIALWQEFRSVRLFTNLPAHRYESPIHEQIAPSIVRAGGRIGNSALRILHYGFTQKTAQGADRARRNLEALLSELRERPEDPYVLYQAGATYKALGDDAAATVHLTRALELDRDGPEAGALSVDGRASARMKLAQTAMSRHDTAVALEEARKCLADEPGNVIALYVVCICCFETGQTSEARETLRTLLSCPDLGAEHRGDLERLLALTGG